MKLARTFHTLAAQLYDATLCSPEGVARQAHVKDRSHTGRKISVAIPHHNRGSCIHRPLRNLLNDGRISEILIVDDASSPAEYEALKRNVHALDPQKKIRIIRQEKNLGAMGNKLSCVENASTEWLILLDSDNTIFRNYLDAVFSLPTWNPEVFYCPCWAYPYFQFQPLVGEQLDFARVAELCRSTILRKIFLLNDGNYFINRTAYLANLSPLSELKNDVADVMVANYLWLSNGGRLEVVPNAHYVHRIDASSFWMRTQEESRRRVFEIFALFEQEKRWTPDLLEQLRKPSPQ